MNNPLALVIFGITSNLAQIKLIPALYDMAEKGLLPKDMIIIGNARKPLSKEEFNNYIESVLNSENKHHQHHIDQKVVKTLLSKMIYIDGNLDDQSFYQRLKELLKSKQISSKQDKIFYLATYPSLYHFVFENLQKLEMNKQTDGFVRLMIEKPIGNDLSSAKQLNQLLLKYFTEDQLYRLDHYLGKETLQNILAFRFGNGLFEPLINKNHIDHIQITASENFGIGKRGGYYDGVGALKDVGQNHQLQMLAFATMDSPKEFTNSEVTKQRLKILQNLIPQPNNLILGQYQGYLQEENITQNSTTNTFYALKTTINNARFKDVPIYIRAGKMLKETVTEIAIIFKEADTRLLEDKDEPNILIYRITPNEGIVFKIYTKKPGSKLQLEPTFMQYCYKQDSINHSLPDPYEKLILDTIMGDQTFFNDAQEIEAQWSFIDPLVNTNQQPIIYKPGSWGPKQANDLIENDGRKWLEPSMLFCKI